MIKMRRLACSGFVLTGILIASGVAAAEPTASKPLTSDAPHVRRKLFFAESSAAEADARAKRTRNQADFARNLRIATSDPATILILFLSLDNRSLLGYSTVIGDDPRQ